MDTNEQFTRLTRPLYKLSAVLEIAAIIGAICGIAFGVAVALVTTHNLSPDFPSDTSTTTNHPLVGAGIAIALEAILFGVVFWAVARGLRLLSADIADRRGIDLSPPTRGGPVWQPSKPSEVVVAPLAPGVRVMNTYVTPPRPGIIEAADAKEDGYFFVRLDDTGEVVRYWRTALRPLRNETEAQANEAPNSGQTPVEP
jgi:hypothetical protein